MLASFANHLLVTLEEVEDILTTITTSKNRQIRSLTSPSHLNLLLATKVVVKTKKVADEKIPVEPGEAMFEEGTVAKVKVYEEQAEVGVEAFVREEVEVKKEVEKEVAEFKETVRKEELEITGEENVEIEK